MPETDLNDRWLDVLAGRAEPHDATTRQAAKAREYFVERSAAEMAPAQDEQRRKRLLNTLEAHGLLTTGKALEHPAPASTSPLARFWAWLFPVTGGAGLRRTALAAALMGVIAAPLLIQHQRDVQGDGDASTMKSLPPGTALGESVQIVQTASPVESAQALQLTLARRGIAMTVTHANGNVRVDADIPAATAPALRDELSALGIARSGGGHLSVEFRLPN